MKKKISFFGIIIFIIISTISLVACNDKNKINKYTKEELIKLKEKNNINTKYGILEGMTPQEKPFEQADNKYYFIIGRSTINSDWILKLIKNINFIKRKEILDTQKYYELVLTRVGDNLFIIKIGSVRPVVSGLKDNRTYFKSVYFGNKNINIPNLVINSKTGEVKVKDK